MAYKFQTKIGQGYLAVEADDYDNFVADLAQVFGQSATDAMLESAAKIDLTAVPEKAPARSSAPASSAASSDGGSAPGGLPADWDTNPPSCTHGKRRPRQWERNGKQNYTWYCDLPQDRRSEQCTPIDALTGKEWGARR